MWKQDGEGWFSQPGWEASLGHEGFEETRSHKCEGNCEVTQTADRGKNLRFRTLIFLIHRKVRNLCSSPFFKTRIWWAVMMQLCPSRRKLPRGGYSSELRNRWDRSDAFMWRVLLHFLIFPPFSWEEWNLQTRFQKYPLNSISLSCIHGQIPFHLHV